MGSTGFRAGRLSSLVVTKGLTTAESNLSDESFWRKSLVPLHHTRQIQCNPYERLWLTPDCAQELGKPLHCISVIINNIHYISVIMNTVYLVMRNPWYCHQLRAWPVCGMFQALLATSKQCAILTVRYSKPWRLKAFLLAHRSHWSLTPLCSRPASAPWPPAAPAVWPPVGEKAGVL